jgi:hypothetical protein
MKVRLLAIDALKEFVASRLIASELIASELRDDGRPSKFFYFDDLPTRRLRPDVLTKARALEAAQEFAAN